jgi:hypothetical protein
VLHALMTLAAQAADEKSKTPFYICGGALAAWAVLVALFGISRHEEWPANEGTARALMGITAVLVIGAMATAVSTA